MKWKLDDPLNIACRDVEQLTLLFYLPEYMVCFKSLLYPAKVWIFNENENMEFRNYQIETEDIWEEPIGAFESKDHGGYQLPCLGDSGSGNWIQRSSDKKHVLVGLASFTSRYCGANAFMEKINNVDSMAWIKSHLNL